jgi:hypothetical protein
MPQPVSVTCSSLLPPSLTTTAMLDVPASRLFSSSSFSADAGRWMTSPAATRFTTSGARRRIGAGTSGGGGGGAVAGASAGSSIAACAVGQL